MRILLVTPVWSGSLGFFCQRALEALGHTIQAFDYRQHVFGHSNYRREQAGLIEAARNRWNIARMNRRLLNAAQVFAPELMLVIKGELISASTVQAIGKGGTATALWYPDTSRPLKSRRYRRVVDGMRHYHVSCLCDAGHVPDIVRRVIRNPQRLTFACDPEFHHQVALSVEEQARFGAPICFVGNWQGTESPRYTWLRQLTDYPITVWGLSWDRSGLIEQGLGVRGQAAYGADLLKVYSSSEITVNFNFDDYLNLRNFEAPACGPLLVTTLVSDLDSYFEPDREVVVFTEIEELRAKLTYYLQNPADAARIAKRGWNAHREHTFQRRMQELFQQVRAA